MTYVGSGAVPAYVFFLSCEIKFQKSKQFKHVWGAYLYGILRLGVTRVGRISHCRKPSVGVALGVVSLPVKQIVRN
jgi:hypothetical protein